jgi:hypothetical protein
MVEIEVTYHKKKKKGIFMPQVYVLNQSHTALDFINFIDGYVLRL